MVRYAIYGCGGFGREVAPLARAQADALNKSIGIIDDSSVVFVSDDEIEIGTTINGIRVLAFEELLKQFPDAGVVIAVGSSLVRRKIAGQCDAVGLCFGNIFAPTTQRLDAVDIGQGSIFCDFSMATSNIKIGKHFHANIYSYVAHDCIIGDFVTLAPKACINGNVILEDDVYVGSGAIIKQGTREKPLRIGKGAVIGMGAVVTKDVPAGVVVVGNPARQLER